MRVWIPAIGKFTYPDCAVVCGNAEYRDAKNDNLVNPILIVEVLSPSTEAYDRGGKFKHYREIESLREYVLIAQNEPRIETFLKKKGTWIFTEAAGLEATITLRSIDCTVELADVYAQVAWDGE